MFLQVILASKKVLEGVQSVCTIIARTIFHDCERFTSLLLTYYVLQDQPMKKTTKGGKKKKKKKYRVATAQYGRTPQPIIGRLFRPLLATENDAPEVLAGQLADRLEEVRCNYHKLKHL